MDMSESFDELPWHDAQLLELSLDRRDAGNHDEVSLQVAWPDGSKATILFKDCYGMTTDMNFGVTASEQVLSALVVHDEAGLRAIQKKWELLDLPLRDLRCYRIETSSTASVIKIYALRFEIA